MPLETFEQRPGAPSEPGEPLVCPPGRIGQRLSAIVSHTGCGSFLGGFLRLFTEDLRAFDSCLDAWSFLLERDCERWVIGKNAYGALLVLEEPNDPASDGRVGMLDPLDVRYVTHPDLRLETLVERWLPHGALPRFLDDALFQAVAAVAGEPLPTNMILALRKPLSLGGSMSPQNVQIEPLLDYYATTGPIYRRALDNARPAATNRGSATAPEAPPPEPKAHVPEAIDPELAARIDGGGDPNEPLASGPLPLRRALELGALKQARGLLKMGADPRRRGDDDRSSLEAAIEAAPGSGPSEFVRRFRSAAQALAREDGPPGVRFVDEVDADPSPHVIAINKGVDQVASLLKTQNGWKSNRRAADRVVLLQQSQAFLLARGRWSLIVFHASTPERREIERSQWEVRLSMGSGPVTGIRGARACTFVDGYPKVEHLGEDARVFLDQEGIVIPPHRFRTDGVTLTLELGGGLSLADVEPVIELPIRSF